MTVFKDRTKLKPGYVPDEFVARDAELGRLAELFRPVLNGDMSQRVLIHGPGGSGKTSLALSFGGKLDREDLRFVYVDCRKQDTQLRISRRLAKGIGLLSPPESSATECLKHLDAHLERKDKKLVAALDWLDFEVSRGDSDLLYYLTRLWECRGGPNRISVIGLSRVPDLIERLDQAVQSSFLHNRVGLDDYEEEELEEILRRRVELAFQHGAVNDDAIKLISESSPSVDGARMAIDWLLHAGTIAQGEGRDRVTGREVGKARRLVHKRVARRDLMNLETRDLLTLLAAIRRMRTQNRRRIHANEVEGEYGKVCKEHGKKPQGHSTFFRRLEKLSDLGIIERKAEKGVPSEITFKGNGLDVLEEIIREQI